MQELSQIFKDRPMSPQETVVYWTEYVLRYKGTRHLRPPIAHKSLYWSVLQDLALFSQIILITVLLLYYIIKIIYSYFFVIKKKSINKGKKKN